MQLWNLLITYRLSTYRQKLKSTKPVVNTVGRRNNNLSLLTQWQGEVQILQKTCVLIKTQDLKYRTKNIFTDRVRQLHQAKESFPKKEKLDGESICLAPCQSLESLQFNLTCMVFQWKVCLETLSDNKRKSQGPDSFSLSRMKACGDHLASSLTLTFNTPFVWCSLLL